MDLLHMTFYAVLTVLLSVAKLGIAPATVDEEVWLNAATDATEASSELDAYATSSGGDAYLDANAAAITGLRASFRILGKDAQSRPCCTSWEPGRVDCFIRGPKSNVLHLAIKNGVYSEWEDLGGIIVDEIECVSSDVGVIDVLVLGTNINLYVNTFSAGKWSGWKSSGGSLFEVPSCAARKPTTVDCMFRSRSNLNYHIGSDEGKWWKWKRIGNFLLVGPFGCASRDAEHFDCFATGWTVHLIQMNWTNGKWGNAADLGGLVKGRPCVTTWDHNRIDVFTLGVKTNSVMQKTYDSGSWLDWVDLGGVFDSAPECVTTGVGKLHCFAIGEESYLYKNSFDGKSWTGWTKSFGYFLETPSCVVSNKDEVTCVARRFNKEIVEITHRV